MARPYHVRGLTPTKNPKIIENSLFRALEHVRRFQDAPRRRQDGRRRLQDASRRLQNGLTRPQDAPRRLQDAILVIFWFKNGAKMTKNDYFFNTI